MLWDFNRNSHSTGTLPLSLCLLHQLQNSYEHKAHVIIVSILCYCDIGIAFGGTKDQRMHELNVDICQQVKVWIINLCYLRQLKSLTILFLNQEFQLIVQQIMLCIYILLLPSSVKNASIFSSESR